MRQIFGPHTERVLPAWDAAAAIAADERIGSGYHVLIRPLKTVMASLPESNMGTRVPAQRGDVSQSRTAKTSKAEQQAQ